MPVLTSTRYKVNSRPRHVIKFKLLIFAREGIMKDLPANHCEDVITQHSILANNNYYSPLPGGPKIINPVGNFVGALL